MKSIIAFFLILCSTLLWSQKLNCKKFKEGNFTYVDKDYGEVKVERSKDIQIEYNEKLDISLTYKIEWPKDCEYILTLIKMEGALNEIPEDPIPTKVHVIEKIGNDFKVYTKLSENHPAKVFLFKRVD